MTYYIGASKRKTHTAKVLDYMTGTYVADGRYNPSLRDISEKNGE